MKVFAIALFLLASVAARADTITLAPTSGFGHLQEFFNVANDRGADIDIYPGEVVIDGVSYLNVGGTYQSADGVIISYTSTLTSALVCVHSGRGQSCYRRWTLLSGTITRG